MGVRVLKTFVTSVLNQDLVFYVCEIYLAGIDNKKQAKLSNDGFTLPDIAIEYENRSNQLSILYRYFSTTTDNNSY